MKKYKFEAMDATGQEISDVIEAENTDEATAKIRQMGYFVTKISEKRDGATPTLPFLVASRGSKKLRPSLMWFWLVILVGVLCIIFGLGEFSEGRWHEGVGLLTLAFVVWTFAITMAKT